MLRIAAAVLALTVSALIALSAHATGGAASAPTPVPAGTSTVTVTYTYHGIPTIAIAQTLAFAYVGGETCEAGGPAIVFETIVSQTTWPWHDHAPCNSVDAPGIRLS